MAEKREHKFITYKGKEILYIDYRNLVPETFLEAITQAHSFLMNSGKKDILELVDITGSFANDKVMEELKRTALESKPLIKKRAAVGITGVKKILLNVVNNFTKEKIIPFNTVEDALEYLASD